MDMPQVSERHIHLYSYTPPSTPKSYSPKTKNNNLVTFNYTAKHSILILIIFLTIFLFFQIPSLRFPPSIESTKKDNGEPSKDFQSMVEKLRDSITFLPLKDLKYSSTALKGHTWFMSSMYDTQEEDDVKYLHFPSNASKGRVLCMKGHDTHDGLRNYYALAWLEALPHNAILMKGLTFVSYNHYDYENIWHGLSVVYPFVAWHMKNGCKLPSRWVLYHWGELRLKMNLWLSLVLQATFDGPVNIEGFKGMEDKQVVCYEEAVVTRHSEGGMSRKRRMQTYDLIRCKARNFCNVSADINDADKIGMTLLMRTGPRSFKNDAAVIHLFRSECNKVKNCRLFVAYSSNLTFCQQVQLMSLTDILVSPHGAQLTNLFLMDRNSSVMEFFPKGWLKLAGAGQYVYKSISSWSGMEYEGSYRDPNGEQCPYSDDHQCMSFYKNGEIGHNDTYFRTWARSVLNKVQVRKITEASNNKSLIDYKPTMSCTCDL